MSAVQLLAAFIQAGLFTFHVRAWRVTEDTVTFGVAVSTVCASVVILGLVL